MCTKHYLNIVRGHSSPFALPISTSEEMVNGTWDMTIAPSSELMITSFWVDLIMVGWWGSSPLTTTVTIELLLSPVYFFNMEENMSSKFEDGLSSRLHYTDTFYGLQFEF
jgi:hypothetical protein